MTCKQQVNEEAILDYVRGNLDEYQENFITHHINECKSCKTTYELWTTIFQDLSTELTPPSHLKKSLMRKIKKKHYKNSRPAFVIFSMSFALIMLLIGYTINPTHRTPNPKPQSFITYQNTAQPFLISEDTDIYEITPDMNQPIKGYAWINNQSNEMMLLVDGLHPISLNDYQAWIKTTNELKNAGVIKIRGQKGQLYIKDNVINNLEHIIVSKEPLGGSETPTDPNPFLIKLNAK